MRAALSKLVNGIRDFLAALSRTKSQPSAPDPRKAAARKMRESMHASRVATSASTNTEPFYAKELSKGYKRQR